MREPLSAPGYVSFFYSHWLISNPKYLQLLVAVEEFTDATMVSWCLVSVWSKAQFTLKKLYAFFLQVLGGLQGRSTEQQIIWRNALTEFLLCSLPLPPVAWFWIYLNAVMQCLVVCSSTIQHVHLNVFFEANTTCDEVAYVADASVYGQECTILAGVWGPF